MNPGSRYVKLLKGRQPNLNNGTVTGGLAHALTQGMRGYAARKADEEDRQKAQQRQQAMTEVLEGMNRKSLTSDGPVAAGNAPFENPGRMAQLLGDPATAPFVMRMVDDALKPPAERFETEFNEQGLPVAQVSSTSGRRLPVPGDPYAPKPPPAGWQRTEDGGMAPIPGGPADPAYRAAIAPPLSPRDQVFASLTPDQQVQAILKPNTQVNMGAQETEEKKAYGKSLVARYDAIQEAADAATQQRALLQQARAINDNPTGVSGMPLPGALKQKAGNAIAAFGIDPASVPGFENISSGQQFNGVMQNIVLSQMQAQKGPQTENDAKRIEQTVASLGNTPRAREFLLDSAMAVNDMKILKRNFWNRFRQEKGTFDGADTAWQKTFGNAGMVRKHPKTKQVLFLPEFMDTVKRENPDATTSQILELWGSYE